MNEKAIYQKALNEWGVQAQITMVFEEMSELQKALCKFLRGANNSQDVCEEIADVEIMLGQMKVLFGDENTIENYKEQKLKRLEKRLTHSNV